LAKQARKRGQSEARPKRTTADRIETRLLGVLKTYERKLARSWAALWIAVMVVVAVGVFVVVVVPALRSNYALEQKVQALTLDLQMERLRSQCTGMLLNRVALTQADVVTPLQQPAWIARCVGRGLANSNGSNGALLTRK
jgi:hypothetical protein